MDGRPNITLELRQCFKIPPAYCGRRLRKLSGAHLLTLLLEFILSQNVSESFPKFDF